MDPYVVAHSTSLILCGIITLYHLGTLVRAKSFREVAPILAWSITFLVFSITEFSLLRYYDATGDPFVINIPRITLNVDVWFYALALILLTFATICTLAFFLMELKILYLVPLAGVVSALYITYLTYRLMGIAFFAYLSFNPILSSTMVVLIGGALLSGLIAVVLFYYIYLGTKSMRALSFGIGTLIVGMFVLGADYLMATLPIAVIGRPLPQREVYLAMLKEWPLNVMYILASLLLFLGQTRVLDAIFKVPSKEEKSWIERMMERI
ncbi:MAG: hypothetical protein NZ992_08385 [Candidatus Korarchaeum sp.]|nr:hypothetical protein [Candidatus Korarchaeum sp.]